VVVLRFSSALAISIGTGLTYSITQTSGDTIVTITAGTDNVVFN
jgi:hypothetical protein